MLRVALALLVGFGLLAAPSLAHACPVCIDPSAASRTAYFNTTILLSLLPLGFIFGCGMFIRARLRAQDEDDRVHPIASRPQEIS